MKRQILASVMFPMAIMLFLLIFFNQSSIDEILKSNNALKRDLERTRIRCEVTDALISGKGSLSERLDRVFAFYSQISAVHAECGGNTVYEYRGQGATEPVEFRFTTSDGARKYDFTVRSQRISLGILSKINFFINTVFAAIFFMLSYMAISSWVTNVLEKPLSQILKGHEKLAKGEYGARIETEMSRSNSEILRIAGSFNTMANELEKFRKELEEKNIKLESVNSKYRNLNEKLEIEVGRKTKELREFFSLITHDLKVPLAAVQGYSALLLKDKTGGLNDKQRKFITNIAITNQHMTHLVRNLIDSFKYDSGKATYLFQDFDLGEIEDEVRTNVSFSLEEKNLELKTNIGGCKTRVCADRTKITRVITNLMSNAIKVSENNAVVELVCEERGGKAYITVRDHGKGIEDGKVEEIFKKFAQFPYSSKSAEGTGLGLYIVKKIIDGHGQSIKVRTAKNEGTSFTFSLNMAGDSENG